MTVKNAAGTGQTKTAVMALMVDVTPDTNKVYRFDGTAPLYEHFSADGALAVDAQKKIGLVPGRLYTKAEIDALYPAASITSITPATGAVAGGTTQTFRGQNLTGTTAITLGGTAYTSVTVVDQNTVTAVTPAKSAGTYDVVLTDDSGTVTKTAAVVVS